MEIPEYWLRRPEVQLTAEHLELLETLHRTAVAPEQGGWIDTPPVPRWVFLTWLCEAKGLLLHGSGHADIALFEPRTPNAKDDDEFSQQTAVFAASDGIWAMFYAILDRTRFQLRMLNAALRFELPGGSLSEPRYFFSVTQEALLQNPWRKGVVYVLPREGFVQQPPYRLGPWKVHDPHWANPKPVRPLAKIWVRPQDFPFLHNVRGHHDGDLIRRFTAHPQGFPWLDG